MIKLLISLGSLTSCAKVEVPNAELCVDWGSDGAFCNRLLSDAPRDVAKPEWDKERAGMVCTKSENFALIRAAIETLCKETKGCEFEQAQKIVARLSALGIHRPRILPRNRNRLKPASN